MMIVHGKGATEFGPGVSINLTGDEVAIAIDAWLVSQRVHVKGPRTINVNDEMIQCGHIYVDPSGSVIVNGQEIFGNGKNDE